MPTAQVPSPPGAPPRQQSFPGYSQGWVAPPSGPTRLVSRGRKGASAGTTIGLGLIIIGLAFIGIGYTWSAVSQEQLYSSCGQFIPSPNPVTCSHLLSNEQNATWEGDLLLGVGVFIAGAGFVLYFTYLPRRVESALSDVEWELGP